MKIAYLITDISGIGGTEKVTSELSSHFANKKNNKITILSCLKSSNSIFYPINKKVKIKYLLPKIKKYPNCAINKLLFYFLVVIKLINIKKRKEYDIIIGQNFVMNLLLYFSGNSKNCIACEHVSFDYYSRLSRFFSFKIYKSFKKLIVLTESDYFHFNKKLSNVVIIPNFVDNDHEYTSTLNNNIIISLGRLEYEKGYDILIDAANLITQKYPDWRFDIYGDGSMRKELESKIRKKNLEKKVSLNGIITNVYQKISEGSIFICPSRSEGFGVALIEAASCGLPLISFKSASGPNEILKNNNGILVNTISASDLAESIELLIKNKALRQYYSKKSLSIAEKYSKKSILKIWEKHLNSE